MARDGWVTVASQLRTHEAAMLRGVLESERIPVAIEDEVMSSLELLPAPFGGARVLVPVAEAERATALMAATGFAAGPPMTFGEISDEEWSSGAAPDAARAAERGASSAGAAHDGARALGRSGFRTGRAPRRAAWALALSVLAVGLAVLVWRAVLSGLGSGE